MFLTHTNSGILGSPRDWLHEFSQRTMAHNPFISVLQPLAYDRTLTDAGAARESSDRNDLRYADLYFFWFTLPVLEAFGRLDRSPTPETVSLAATQLCFGLHLQHLDDVIDETLSPGERATQLKRSRVYYARALQNLKAAGFEWSDSQEDTYVQFLEYEREIAAGDFSDCYLLWRRASPLCVLTDTYLGSNPSSLVIKEAYRRFISWSLLHSDCNDALKDLRLGHITPVTVVLSEELTEGRTDFREGDKVINHITQLLSRVENAIRVTLLDQHMPLWTEILAIASNMMTRLKALSDPNGHVLTGS